MKIGVIKEIKDKENRVALIPYGTQRLIAEGHTILLEDNAGLNSGFNNQEYQSLGTEIVSTEEAWVPIWSSRLKNLYPPSSKNCGTIRFSTPTSTWLRHRS